MAVLQIGPTPLYYQIKKIISRQIESGELRPGDQLPSEGQLLEQYGVSRITVRQALKDLVNEGLLYRRQGKGTYVASRNVERTFVRLRCLVEDMADGGTPLATRLLSVQTCSAAEDVAARLQLPVGSPLVRISRLRSVDHQPILVDVLYFPPEIGDSIASKNLETRTIAEVLENDYHLSIEEADYSIQARRADREQAELLNLAPDDPILLVERTSYSRDGKPVDLQRRYYRPDRFQYEMRIKRLHRSDLDL